MEKVKEILLTAMLFLVAIVANAQISIYHDSGVKPGKKEYVYDSTENIVMHNGSYKHLIGQELFFYGDTTLRYNHDGSFFKWMPAKKKKKGKVKEFLPRNAFFKHYLRLCDVGVDEASSIYSGKKYIWTLYDGFLKDTVMYQSEKPIQNTWWTVVGHFEKMKDSIMGKEFYLPMNLLHYDFKIEIGGDLSQEEKDKIRSRGLDESFWKCVDVTLKAGYHQWDQSNIIGVFERENTAIPMKGLLYIDKNVISQGISDGPLGMFTTKEAELAKRRAETEPYLRKLLGRQEREDSLTNLYGKDIAITIMIGQVELGFTRAMCLEAWGKPIKINTTKGSYGTHEQWVYSLDKYLYFENGKLTDIQY